jgi:hypothetical protein
VVERRVDIAGPTGGKNEQLLDGTPLNISRAALITCPWMRAGIDRAAERHGFRVRSAGGTLNLAKSGTNEYHGRSTISTQSGTERAGQPHHPRPEHRQDEYLWWRHWPSNIKMAVQRSFTKSEASRSRPAKNRPCRPTPKRAGFLTNLTPRRSDDLGRLP